MHDGVKHAFNIFDKDEIVIWTEDINIDKTKNREVNYNRPTLTEKIFTCGDSKALRITVNTDK